MPPVPLFSLCLYVHKTGATGPLSVNSVPLW